MDGAGPSSPRDSVRDASSGPSPVLGRVSVWVGCLPPRSFRVRGVVGGGTVAAHQPPRDEGNVSGIAVISGDSRQSSGGRDVRQLNGCGLRQQAGRNVVPFPLPLLIDQSPSQVDRNLDVHLDERYLPGQSNVLADLLSRRAQVIGTEWSLHLQVVRALFRVWGSPSLDLFTTRLSTKLPLYCSLVPDPQAVFEDAFCHPWDNLDVYVFSPYPLVCRVVARDRETLNPSMTLVAPLWLEKWFPDLLLLLTQPPLVLPWWSRLLWQPHFSCFHQGVHTLNLHAL